MPIRIFPGSRASARLRSSGIRVPGGAALALILAAGPTGSPPEAALPRTVTVRNFFGTMTFDRPVLFRPVPGRDSVYAVVQQSGEILVVRRENGVWTKTRFDSLRVTGVNGIVNPRGEGEGTPAGLTDDGGLLGLAFHPDYATNRKYYVQYVDPAYPGGTTYPGTIVLAERTADASSPKASGSPQRVLLALPKPYVWHNGGTLRFGTDRFLYAAVGDGGAAGDPDDRAQDPAQLFGKFLRIDVDGPDAFPGDTTRNYAIPDDNPFVDRAGWLPEIWAYGLRNPWKWAFHPETGEIWAGDVGQNRHEEITRVPKGANLGWNLREGAACHPSGEDCADEGLTAPVLAFASRLDAASVTGGVFFTGDTTSAFHGAYLFGDFVHDRIWALREEDGRLRDTTFVATVPNPASFDKDEKGRIVVVSLSGTPDSYDITGDDGAVYVLESPDMRPDPTRLARTRPAPEHPAFRFEDVYRHPERYVITGLDGRTLSHAPRGSFFVRRKGGDKLSRLMTSVSP